MITLDPDEVLPSGVLIGDELVARTSVGELAHHNATTGKVQRHFAAAGPAEVDAAVRAAADVLPTWRAFRPTDRRDVLLRLAALLRANTAEFAAISTLEAAMTVPLATFQAPRAAEWIEYYAGWADKVEGTTVGIPGTLDYTVHEPVGVVAVILTWNGPTGTIGMKVPAALAAGCTVVLKPAELAPFSAIRFGQLCLEAGMPPGVVNVVPGGAEAGDTLVRHPGIAKISFTGGPATAQRIQAACAETLTPLLLELGGKSANLVFADADLDIAALKSAMGIVGMSGQACVAPTRLLVEEAAHDELMERILSHLRAVRLGDPALPETTMGPVISSAAVERIVATIDRARDEGAGLLVTGGRRGDGDLADGYFLEPTVFVDVDPASDLARNEVFGPVLSVIRFSSEGDAVTLANDSPFGLAAYVHTSNVSRAIRLANQLDAGNVSINGGAVVAGPYAPFGGFKRSGYGKEGGLAGLLEYTRTKNVNIGVLG